MVPTFPTSWDDCLAALKAVLPGAGSLGIDEIYRAARAQGRSIELHSLPHWESLDDGQILAKVLEAAIIRGNDRAILLPAICFYGLHLPFCVSFQDLTEFVAGFFEKYGEAFFNGDTIIILASGGVIYLFDHNGNYSAVLAEA